MKKYGLFCPIRQPNPYKKMMKAMEESTVAPNILERKFREYNTLELNVTVYFYDAFKSIIPYLTKKLKCDAHVYVAFRISFIPKTFRKKIITNI